MRVGVFIVLLCGPRAANMTSLSRASVMTICAALAAGCGSDPAPSDAESSAGDTESLPAPDPGDDCFELACLDCSRGTECAESGDPIEDTCCTVGDNLVYRSAGAGSEVVDLESNGTHAILCGGFGARISNVTDPQSPISIGSASNRCQHAAFGPVLADGSQAFYTAHHGDTWAGAPALSTFLITAADTIEPVDVESFDDVLYEGMAYSGGYLYVAVHSQGVRVYRTGADGAPEHERTVEGFDNATKIDVEDGFGYVADSVGGVKVLALDDPSDPKIVQRLDTNGLARDVDADGGRVFVALGAAGVDVFDATDPGNLVAETNVQESGSVQGVAADGCLLALANWTHVALRDAETLQLLGTEDLLAYPEFEQDLGIGISGNVLYVGEWEGLHILEYRPGYVAPDILIEQDVFSFLPGEQSSLVAVVRNRGFLDLEVTDISTSDAAFTLDKTSFTLAPGQAEAFEITFTPPSDPVATNTTIRIESNDPDPSQSALQIPLSAAETQSLDVGDQLTANFGFLDVDGTGDVQNLEGKVIVLAYFALF